MKILEHRHTGLIVYNIDLMLDFYVGMGLVLRRRDMEKGPMINSLLGTKNLLLETAKLVLIDELNPIGYSFQLELMKVKNENNFDEKRNKTAFDFVSRPLGVLDIAFTVDDLGATRKFIVSSGGDLVGEPLKLVGGFPALHCYARDPEGNVLHLAQNLEA